jgi:hypothetical protein
MRYHLIIVFAFALSLGYGQMITDLGLRELTISFNPTYIKNNNIKEVLAHTSYKKELKPIVDKHLYNRYVFDKNGRMIELVENYKTSPTSIDSLITEFIYSNGKLDEKRVSDAYGHHAYSFSYNEKNDIAKMQYHRVNDSTSPILVLEEHYEYETLSDTSYIKLYLNQYGKHYQKELYIYNKLGYLLSVEKRMVFGGGFTLQSYNYDAQGRIVEWSENNSGSKMRIVYRYDKFSNLIEKDTYKNEELHYHDEFLYDSKTSLIKAQLSKETKTNTIFITKFEVVFR